MPFEDVMGTVMRWTTATEALAALGAELALQQTDVEAPPEIVAALRAVSTAGGLTDLAELPPPQQAMVAGMIRMYLHQALDLVEHPEKAPGWIVTDPAVLDGWGRGSAMIPHLIAAAHPDLAEITSFLDVGTGVGLLAVSAASVWPASTVVGIDPWDVALERARANVTQAGLDARITLRRAALADIEDTAAFDCVWIPTFFVSEADLEAGLTAAVHSLRPGGWIALGRSQSPPDPLAEATADLRWIRGGGSVLDTKRATALLEAAGCVAVHAVPPPGMVPMELVLGKRPTT